MTRLVILRPLFKDYTYTMRRGLAKGLKRKGGMSFVPSWGTPSKEDEFLKQLDLTGKTVFDIGAFEGVFTLFFAQAVGPTGTVYTFEPNPINYSRTLENVVLNDFNHVQVFNTALGEVAGRLSLMFSAFEAGSGSLHAEVQTKFSDADKPLQAQVSVDTLDNQMTTHNLSIPDLIKLDVEGFEPKVLRGMQSLLAKVRPAFFIELHGFMLTTERTNYWRELVEPLLSLGYEIKHIETDQSISLKMTTPPLSGHLYCQVT
ncbi:FkbM family methyltransferase [Leptothoe sp. PORK10 BA2]|uniref:FkbM family methyltransferase n=1 Tax=Leptothoe sp. PORK10 BA2 TaxID=3110254 RepID=UPI002B1F09BE|nr:FkbM family methyltransferase [Leptothoe sp. PORK10 BA2]MEA5464689.1 FkbM family methyltransferase [Leptothoe sp. PORK10 BA2]